MKGIFKLVSTTLAMAAVTASCVNDDILLGQGSQSSESQKGDLIVEFDPIDNDASTRALRDMNFKTLTWENGDVMKVYDEKLYAYDTYEYNNAFYRKGSKLIESKYALFPGDKVLRSYIDRGTDGTGEIEVKSEFKIDHVITYNASSEVMIDEENQTIAYACNLPMFGYAYDQDGTNVVKVENLRYLTGILRLGIKNAFSNATFLRLSNAAGKSLAGTFVTTPLQTDPELRKEVKLKDGMADLITYPELYIDLRNVPSATSVIYVPVIPGLDGDRDGIKLEYTAWDGDDVVKYDDGKTIEWTEIGMKLPNVIFKQNEVQTGTNTFGLDDMTPNKLSKMLDLYKESPTNIKVDLGGTFSYGDNSSDSKNSKGEFNYFGNIIKLPAFTNNVNVEINFSSSLNTLWAGSKNGEGNATNYDLVFEDADPNNPFKGTVTFNVGTVANKKPLSGIQVNLKEGNAVLLGDYTTTSLEGKKLTLNSANTVTIGSANADPNTTKFNNAKIVLVGKLGDDVKNLVIEKSAQVMPLNSVKVTDGKVSDESKAATNQNITAGVNTASITVNGKVTGDIFGSTSTAAVANTIAVGVSNVQTTAATYGYVTGQIDAKDANTAVTVTGGVVGNGIIVGKANELVSVANVKENGKIVATGTILKNGIKTRSEVKGSQININGKVTGNIDTWAANNDRADEEIYVTLEEKGQVVGNIAMNKAVKGKLTIKSSPKAIAGTTDLAPNTIVVSGTVKMQGDVEIDLADEGIAIENIITMLGAKKELKLLQGYVKEIDVNVNNTGTWEDKYIDLTLVREGEVASGLNAFLTLKTLEDDEYHILSDVKYTMSKWNGEFITARDYVGQQTTYTNARAELGSTLNGKKYFVFTAAQLASLTNPANDVHLYNNIDLNKKTTWKGITTLTKNFDGHSDKYAISNLDLSYLNKNGSKINAKASNLGLINSVTAAVTVKDLKIDGVTGTITGYTAVGALAGTNTAALTINNVNVNNVVLTAAANTNEATQIGGLVGKAAADLTLTKSTVKGLSLQGYKQIGGLIGFVEAANVEFTECSATGEITPVVKDNNEMDINYARVGTFIGSANTKSSGKVIKLDKFPATTDVNFANADEILAKRYISNTEAGVGSFYHFARVQDVIGYCGVNSTTVAVSEQSTLGSVYLKPNTTNSYTVGGFVTTPDNQVTKTWLLYYMHVSKTAENEEHKQVKGQR